MTDLLRLIQSAPTALKLITLAQRAAAGDPEAIAQIKAGGWSEGLDLLRPGAGQIAQRAVDAGRETLQYLRNGPGQIIDGEAHEVVPWEHFVRRLLNQPNSAHIILGPTGSGKTTLAMRLAQRLSEVQGYQVEFCNVYGNDLPNFGTTIQIETLVKRMKQLAAYLKSQATEDKEENEGLDPEPKKHTKPVGLPPTNRVIVIDEAILAMTSNPNDPGRKAALQALAQCRHLRWHCIYIGQWAGQLPLPLLGQSILWVKKPNGRESSTDRDHPVVRNLWERAGAGFAQLHGSAYYREPWTNDKSWAFCDCESLNGSSGYHGMVAFTPVDTAVAGEYRELEAE